MESERLRIGMLGIMQDLYDEIYSVYCGLHDTLGTEHVEWLHNLKRIRRMASQPEAHSTNGFDH